LLRELGSEDRRQVAPAVNDAHKHDPARLRLVEKDILANGK
jgi:hypothetical protein